MGQSRWADTCFRALGRGKGDKQLLNTSAGLVPTVVRNELIVHGRLVQCKEPTTLRGSLGPGSELGLPHCVPLPLLCLAQFIRRSFRHGRPVLCVTLLTWTCWWFDYSFHQSERTSQSGGLGKGAASHSLASLEP
jgi:hypothetical protein